MNIEKERLLVGKAVGIKPAFLGAVIRVVKAELDYKAYALPKGMTNPVISIRCNIIATENPNGIPAFKANGMHEISISTFLPDNVKVGSEPTL